MIRQGALGKIAFLIGATLIWWIHDFFIVSILAIIVSAFALAAFGKGTIIRGLPFSLVVSVIVFLTVFVLEYLFSNRAGAAAWALSSSLKWFVTLLPIYYALSGEIADDLVFLALNGYREMSPGGSHPRQIKNFDAVYMACALGVPLYWGWRELKRLREARIYWKGDERRGKFYFLENVLIDFFIGMISRWQAVERALRHRGYTGTKLD